MASGGSPARPAPAWYQRLPPSRRRVAAASDRVSSLPLRAGPELQAATHGLPDALASRAPRVVEPVAQRIADGVCTALGVPAVRIRVRSRRPRNVHSELQGLYVPLASPARPEITLWMLTAVRGNVVAHRTFLRTLLHELCHHLDYTWLRLQESMHTQGFYQRESSLLAALENGGPRP